MSTNVDLINFLFVADVDITQAESILNSFSNFSLPSYDDFYEFFRNNGIKLQITKQRNQTDMMSLLEKLKSFKQTYEYEILKKYIVQQKEASLLLGTRDVQAIRDAINSIEQYNLDVFDNYIVRKILTGSDTGTLPSENLKRLLEELIKVNTDIFPEDADLERDDYSVLISYQNIFRNRGRIKVPVLDDRFTTSKFNYVVERMFESLPEAASSERNFRKKTEGMTTSAEFDLFLSDIMNLRNEDENSIAGLQAKVENLQSIIDAKQELINSMIDKEIENEAFIDSIALDNINKEQEIEDKNQAIQGLQTTVDSTLAKIQNDVTNQINNITSAFDSLQETISDQANTVNKNQDTEINNLKKQIEDLKNQLSKLGGSGNSGGSGGSGGSSGSTNVGVGGPSGPLGGNPAGQGGPSIGN
jgi:hypothetical protein